jgi:hypothetical protein
MAYTLATIVQIDPAAPDRPARMVVEFTGAGETAVRRERYIDVPAAQLAAWARNVKAELDTKKTAVTGLTVGQTLSLTAPTETALEIAERVWREKAARLAKYKSLGSVTGQLATDITALQTDVQNTYLTAYIGKTF